MMIEILVRSTHKAYFINIDFLKLILGFFLWKKKSKFFSINIYYLLKFTESLEIQ